MCSLSPLCVSALTDERKPQKVVRIVGAFKLNPYEILELDWMPTAGVSEPDIRESSSPPPSPSPDPARMV